MTKDTITDLPNDIEALIPEAERTPLIQQIIDEARAGEFDDFKNDKYAAPKMALVVLLTATKDERLLKLAEDVRMGVYDE